VQLVPRVGRRASRPHQLAFQPSRKRLVGAIEFCQRQFDDIDRV
jgi:hypothetical protein